MPSFSSTLSFILSTYKIFLTKNLKSKITLFWLLIVVQGSYIDILISINISFRISISIVKAFISISFPAPVRQNFQNSVVVYPFPVV